MEYVLGIDAGGTKFLVRACDLNGNRIGEYVTGSCNTHSEGEVHLRTSVPREIKNAIASFGLKMEDCRYLVVGSTGVDCPADQILLDEVYASVGLPCPFIVMNDTEIALYAACGGIGALIIAGTGSIAAGKNSKGETTRTGGWGTSIGSDQGCGRDITLRAMYALSLYLDAVIDEEDSPLVALLRKEFPADTDWLTSVSRHYKDHPDVIKKVPPLVDKAYEMGDPYAKEIIKHIIDSVVWLGDTIIKKLDLDKEPTFKVAIWGSVALKCPYVYPGVKEIWEAKYPNIEVIYPTKDAADGAIMMALESLKGDKSHSDRRFTETRK